MVKPKLFVHIITFFLLPILDSGVNLANQQQANSHAEAEGKSAVWTTKGWLVGGLEHEFYFSIQLGNHPN